MDRHRQPQLGHRGPQGLEPRVADRDAAPRRVAQPQAEVLPHLHADRAVLGGGAHAAFERALEARSRVDAS
jgi:hypothetical protein